MHSPATARREEMAKSLFHEHGEAMLILADRHLGNRQDAEEVIQDAFAITISKMVSGTVNDPPALLCAIVRKLIKQKARGRARHAKKCNRAATDPVFANSPQTPHDVLEARHREEVRRFIRAAVLRRFGPEDAEFFLAAQDEVPIRELMVMFQMKNDQAVYNRLRDLRNALFDVLRVNREDKSIASLNNQ